MISITHYTASQVALCIPEPQGDANKYTRGVLMVIGGSAAYPGAATMAALAGQRTGAGYTQVWCAPESVDAVRFGHASLVVGAWDGARFDAALTKVQNHKSALVVGCGTESSDSQMPTLVSRILSSVQQPVLVDGGALGVLTASSMTETLTRRAQTNAPLVLTPHTGEAARLSVAYGISAESEAQLSRRLARAYHAVVALKGPQTYISDGQQVVEVSSGTPALAKAGTGDVLAGVIGALLAQGVNPFDAAVAGVHIHAHAGCISQDKYGVAGVIPEDVIEAVPLALLDFMDLRAE